MEIEQFNALPAAEATAQLEACARIPAWAEAVVAARPYGDKAALLSHADDLASAWTDEQVSQALADHPRIGEKHAGAGAGADHSKREQAGVDPADTDVRQRLADGNRRYEETFDRIFLVRAAGRSAEEILALLDERLTNDPATELRVTAGQLAEIAALRLAGLVT